ncbi:MULTISPECIES: siderophore ABC transporter substrate-binding protein [unclassified Streptomyces]|uniref:siderophore ABC transporter substrate-binding protein n=1 Tax=unclassified Streptomyces TaxID=2593676 RepID=UPI00136BEBD9|nr:MULTISPECIES: ABC transporter substrate-binding protein [unclassified Streptomyces]MCW5253710.1 ABC transporter substrate-binding protein [Streptomyces sp. SHP 1-2]MYU23054.1 ABC transporter substrate-binding protein [Streptomyces sp. SID8352]
MLTQRRHLLAVTAVSTVLTFGLAGCAGGDSDGKDSKGAAKATAAKTVEVEDNHGTQKVKLPAKSVVATDNRTFQTLSDWGIKLSAAPVDLIATDNPYKSDKSIVNLGLHNEPDLEAVVAVEPDLIVNGQRFSSFYKDLKKLAPDAAIVELDPREDKPFDEELKRQVETLGKIFGHEKDAKKLVEDFDASVARVKKVYDPKSSVIGVITSGGEINYAAPGTGRTVGPVFDILGLTPAIKTDGSSDHQGDDISVEAIAAAKPDVIIALDRDAAVSAGTSESYVPANEMLAKSEALKNVPAVKNGNIVYFPQLTYLNEGIQTYTAFFNGLADKLEANA